MGEDQKPVVDFTDFQKIDIRIGRITEVLPFPRARNPSYKVAVDLGPLGVRWSSAQITSYSVEALIGKEVACVCNFALRNIAGFASEILILGARDTNGNVIVLSPTSEIQVGQTVF